jgi:pimeloyl-ACP methyl ester carboxylesterase
LFFHGQSYFPENRIEKEPLKLSQFIHLFNQILVTENVQKFHLLAFSQGGRFSLCLTPFFGAQIETLTLIAPDGMDNYSFYNWSSRQRLARKLFTYLEQHPKKVLRYSTLATKLHLMRPKVKEFVHEFASNQTKFKKASSTWRAFRLLLPDNAAIAKTLKEKGIPFLIIMGKFDQVIRPKQAYRFAKRLGISNCVIEIENGHNFFKKSAIGRFEKLLPFN